MPLVVCLWSLSNFNKRRASLKRHCSFISFNLTGCYPSHWKPSFCLFRPSAFTFHIPTGVLGRHLLCGGWELIVWGLFSVARLLPRPLNLVGNVFALTQVSAASSYNPTNDSRFALQLSIFTQIPPFKGIFRSKIPSNVWNPWPGFLIFATVSLKLRILFQNSSPIFTFRPSVLKRHTPPYLHYMTF